MATKFEPDLTKLGNNYQILTELHAEDDSRTYLARHLGLNRDVTITALRSPENDGGDALSQVAADARLLATGRHPNVVPVIEGIWLDRTTFAIVRARVRGATLNQLVETVGPVPVARVATAIRDVSAAVDWARNCGVAHRNIAPWDMVFQQGSGRVLLSFEPAPLSPSSQAGVCNDVQAIGQLASAMLTGAIGGRVAASMETSTSDQIPPRVAEALAAVRRCDRSTASASLGALLTALDEAALQRPVDEQTQIATVSAAPVATAAVNEPTAVVSERVVPAVVTQYADAHQGRMPVFTNVPRTRSARQQVSRDDAVVVRKPSFGFNARLGAAIAVVAIVGTLGLLVTQHRETPVSTTASTPRDTTNTASGDVALRSAPAQSAPTSRYVPPAVQPQAPLPSTVPPTTAAPVPRPVQPTTGVASMPSAIRPTTTTTPVQKAVPATTVAPPERPVPRPVDSAAEAERKFQRDSAADVADPCVSADSADQRKCLANATARNDREVTSVLARLVAALRRKSGVAESDPDPDAVVELRAAQRAWSAERDAACRDVGEEPFFAKSRAACYAQQSTNRARELQRMLDGISPSN